MRTASRLVLAAALLLTPLAAHAASYWTATGSTGVISPQNGYVVSNPITGIDAYATVLSWSNSGSGPGITYNSSYTGTGSAPPVVYNVTSSTAKPGWTGLEIGFTGITTSGSYISATLYQVDPTTGNTTSLCSVGTPVGYNFQGCNFSSTAMDFSSYAYYVQVVLSRTAKTQYPQINYLNVH
jgi:hypothetical protein